jgi:hypothetical protein
MSSERRSSRRSCPPVAPRVPRGRRADVGHPARSAVALLALALLAAPAAREAVAQHYVATADSTRPRLKFADSLVSVNDRCVVTHNKLNAQIPPVYVNGRPVGFC